MLLNILRTNVKRCVNNQSKYEECNLVRSHYTDLRGIIQGDIKKATNEISTLWYMETYKKNNVILNKISTILTKISKMNWIEFKEYVKNQILSVPKIRKEYDRTTEQKMIYNFMDDFLEDQKKILGKFVKI